MNDCTSRGETKMIRIGRFVLAIVTFVAFGLNSTNYAHAWDFTLRGNGSSSLRGSASALPENAPEAASTPTFSPNQNVTVNFNGKIVAAHPVPVLPTVLPYNPLVPIVNVEPVVTSGQRPLVVGGPSCTITIYGVDGAGNLYDISSAAWMATPRVVNWQGGTVIPNQPTNPNTILQIGVTTVPGSPGQAVGMSFTEQAPAVQANPAYNIDVSAVVIMDALLPNGSEQGWTFNDLLNTVATGTVVPPPPPTYDLTLEIAADPPYTMRLLGVPAANISAVAP